MTDIEKDDALSESHARIFVLEEALCKILAIENNTTGGDWDEIEEAREIAREALELVTDTR